MVTHMLESDYKLYVQDTAYISKTPSIDIQEGSLSLVNFLTEK